MHGHYAFLNFKQPKHFSFLPGVNGKMVSTEKLEVSIKSSNPCFFYFLWTGVFLLLILI